MNEKKKTFFPSKDKTLSRHAIVRLIIIIVTDLPEGTTGCLLFIVVH